MSDKPKDVTRHIKGVVAEMLWAKAAGRCQFSGHNIPLYKSPVTQEPVNIAQKAHIYSFSQDGPRGWGLFALNRKKLNDVDNLMLMCPACHKLIDEDEDGEKYSADLLRSWKKAHEDRIALVTGIAADKKSNVVFYASNIGKERTRLNKVEAFEAMFPNNYPAENQPIDLSMDWSGQDCNADFWTTESENLDREFSRKISSVHAMSETVHFSVFAFAPMPLLVKLGTLFTDKVNVCTYQAIREPQGWHWQEFPPDFEFIVNEPSEIKGDPALVISISGKIDNSRVNEVLGENVTIWEITVPEKHLHNDCIRHYSQLSMFRQAIRKLICKIEKNHGAKTPLSFFPAMSVSCSVELGRGRMPKAGMPWILYDQNNTKKKFIYSITIGDEND